MSLPVVINPLAEEDLQEARSWPYGVFYRIDDDQVTVIAVYHARRNPRGWQDREET